MRIRSLLSLFLLCACLWAQGLEDGPQVLWEGSTARVLRVHGGKLQERRLGKPWRLALEGLPPLSLDPAPLKLPPAVWPEPARITAVSDIHGNLRGFKHLLQAQGVVDAQMRWSYGKGHLVILGDVADRGQQVTEAFWFIRSLEAQASQSGGQVHMLLGNHELLLLRGDHRYLAPKYRSLETLYPRTVSGMAGPDSELGRWLRTRPTALRLGRFLFVHGGISPALANPTLDLDALNAEIRTLLDDPGKPSLLGSEGPFWYRGLLPETESRRPAASTSEVQAVLRSCGAEAVVVGHTTLPQVEGFHGGRVFGIDAGLKDDQPGGVWIWLDGRPWRGLSDGRREPLGFPAQPLGLPSQTRFRSFTPIPEEISPCHANSTTWGLQACFA